MKNIKFLGLVGLMCSALLLTGCGGSAHTLVCDKKDDDQELHVEVKFNDKETEAEKVSMEMSMSAPEGTSDSDMQSYKSLLEANCASGSYDKCDVSIKGNKITMKVEGSAESLEFGKGTLKESKKDAEDSGYTCK